MLYITTHHNNRIVWHVGTPKPPITPADVAEVQADGEELQHIILRMKGLPTVDDTLVVRWFGDHARFIVGNLK